MAHARRAGAPDDGQPGPGDQAGASSSRPPGRPRDAALDQAILAAAERQLVKRGYAGMSLEAVAAAAGTTTPSLRRRFRGKTELAAAVIDTLRVEPLPEPTGDPRADALAVLENLRANMLRPDGMATLGSILAEENRHPRLLQRFRQRLVEPRRERLRRALLAGIDQGQLPARLDLDMTVNLLVGSCYARYLAAATIPADWPDRALTVVWPIPGSRDPS
ncbi:MAG TPA: TetR/AcrR family transcriptional regulator C-terminal ligand-binding domain-containing protein [Streptosporangiaceae bacterium]